MEWKKQGKAQGSHSNLTVKTISAQYKSKNKGGSCLEQKAYNILTEVVPQHRCSHHRKRKHFKDSMRQNHSKTISHNLQSTAESMIFKQTSKRYLSKQISQLRLEFEKENQRIRSFMKYYTAQNSRYLQVKREEKISLNSKINQQAALVQSLTIFKPFR